MKSRERQVAMLPQTDSETNDPLQEMSDGDLVRLAQNVADLECDRPAVLVALYHAALEDGFVHLSPVDWIAVQMVQLFRPLRGGNEHFKGKSPLREDVCVFIQEAVFLEGWGDDETPVLKMPIGDSHPAFTRVLEALKSRGAHSRRRLRHYSKEF